MKSEKFTGRFWVSDTAILLYLAFAATIGHILVSGNYGYHIDELYVIACSKHLSFGFVDMPPLTPALMALCTSILGSSLWAIRLLPALVSGLMVLMIGFMVKQIGGGRFAVFLAGLAAALASVWMVLDCFFCYDFLDQFLVVLLFTAFLYLIKTSNLKVWLLIGVITGIGLLNKTSVIFFIFVLILVMLMTKNRKHFLTPWPWLGASIALVMILPMILWQIQHGFPLLEFWGTYSGTKAVDANPLQYLMMQAISINIALLPVWVSGLYYLLFQRDGKPYRLFGIAFLLLLALFIMIRSQVYMMTPTFAILLASGSIQIESFFKRKRRMLLQFSFIFLILLFGLLQAPIFLPILPINRLVNYYGVAGGLMGTKSLKYGHEQFIELPIYIYNQLEWDTLVNDVAAVYQGLPENERADTGILTRNYGWSGAIDFLGAKKGLPQTACGHVNYYLFSLDDLHQKTWVVVGESPEYLAGAFQEVTLAKISKTKYRLPLEVPIYICRGPKLTADELRQYVKKFE